MGVHVVATNWIWLNNQCATFTHLLCQITFTTCLRVGVILLPEIQRHFCFPHLLLCLFWSGVQWWWYEKQCPTSVFSWQMSIVNNKFWFSDEINTRSYRLSGTQKLCRIFAKESKISNERLAQGNTSQQVDRCRPNGLCVPSCTNILLPHWSVMSWRCIFQNVEWNVLIWLL